MSSHIFLLYAQLEGLIPDASPEPEFDHGGRLEDDWAPENDTRPEEEVEQVWASQEPYLAAAAAPLQRSHTFIHTMDSCRSLACGRSCTFPAWSLLHLHNKPLPQPRPPPRRQPCLAWPHFHPHHLRLPQPRS
eukprot:364655-Chlamydomonas_euryale.AAC.6